MEEDDSKQKVWTINKYTRMRQEVERPIWLISTSASGQIIITPIGVD